MWLSVPEKKKGERGKYIVLLICQEGGKMFYALQLIEINEKDLTEKMPYLEKLRKWTCLVNK